MINIICVVPSLFVINNNLYLKLKSILGDTLERDIKMRTMRMESKTTMIAFVSCKQTIQAVGGVDIDIAIIADPNITIEWLEFLKNKVRVHNGILMWCNE